MKGVVLASCGQLGLDWERISLSGYVEALNAGEGSDGGGGEASTGLKRFLKAHGVANDG